MKVNSIKFSKVWALVSSFALVSLLSANSAFAQYYYPNNNYSYYYPGSYYANNSYNYGYSSLIPNTSGVSNLSHNSATLNGYVSMQSSGYSNYQNLAWFEYGLSYNSLSNSTNKVRVTSSTAINAHISNLNCGQTYYYRAVSSGSNGVQYGSVLSFTTSACYTNNYYSNYPYYNYYNYNNSWWQYQQSFPTNCVRDNYLWSY